MLPGSPLTGFWIALRIAARFLVWSLALPRREFPATENSIECQTKCE